MWSSRWTTFHYFCTVPATVPEGDQQESIVFLVFIIFFNMFIDNHIK